jgi:release factor glutamine methyltransferase
MTEKELLLTALLNCKRADLYAEDHFLDRGQKEKLSVMLKRRQQGEPVQYIIGFTEFMGFYLKTDKRALIPRPETEILVENTFELIKNNFSQLDKRDIKKTKDTKINILDIGTGSGNIAISLARLLDDSQIVATDISEEALELAEENAKINEVYKKIIFLKSDLFETGFEKKHNFFDIIVCNPPYLTTDEFEKSAIDLMYEPRIALDAGRDGFRFYRKIIKQAVRYLRENGYLIFEIGHNQSMKFRGVVDNSKGFIIERMIKDYNGIDRVVILKKTIKYG